MVTVITQLKQVGRFCNEHLLMYILKTLKMGENNCEDLSDLEIQTKTWNKIEKNMKLIGFREGAAKGRDQALQEGFNLGYNVGFDLGIQIGQIKGILSCPVELTSVIDSKFSEKNMEKVLDKPCIMCLKGKNDAGEKENYPDVDEIMLQQQMLSNDIINNLQNLN